MGEERAEGITRSCLARLGGGLVGAIAGVPFGVGAALFLPFPILGKDCGLDEYAAIACLFADLVDLVVNVVACVGIAMIVGAVAGWWIGKMAATKDRAAPR